MTDRASLVLNTKRGPPRHRHVPDAPVGGYHITTAPQPAISDLSVLDHEREIAMALAELDELDEIMLKLEDDITGFQSLLDDPSTDAWDRIDAENHLTSLTERHTDLRYQVIQRAVELGTHGGYLLGEWGDDEIVTIGRHLSHIDGALPRVLATSPGIESMPAWRMLAGEAVPF